MHKRHVPSADQRDGGQELAVYPRAQIGARVVHRDGGERSHGLGVFAAADRLLQIAEALLVVEADHVVAAVRFLDLLGPADLVLIVAVVHLHYRQYFAVQLAVQRQPAGFVAAFEGELRDKGDFGHHHTVLGGVREGRDHRVGALAGEQRWQLQQSQRNDDRPHIEDLRRL